ncbi:sensor domain-containing diguanylate cyclase [Methylopila sp. Yamaguchi]|uniref:sensor domain-containing diguanylate cyclase n=1 Tax=Methylopila sp. Yamaguchi TaxID=1437817 RepID=UPI000CA93E05|nr:diguanylate cyclase [Methylopila sp. Yamaguchi]GBD47439.1 diguanylate cyclase domain-containing protein [Methylopila sp. Yamaguchi]
MRLQHILSVFGIRSRLIVLVTGAVLPLLALLIAGAIDDRRLAIERAADDVRATARLVAERQSQVFDDAVVLLSTLSTLAGIDAAGPAECGGLVARAADRNKQFMTIGVVDRSGDVVCHSRLDKRVRFTDVELLARALSGRPGDTLIGRLVVGRVTGRPTIAVATPTAKDGAAVDGMLFASIDLGAMSDLADQSDQGGARSVSVIDARDGKVVAGSGALRRLINASVEGHPLLTALVGARYEGSAEVRGLNGVDEIVGFAPLRIQGLSRPVVVVGAPLDAVLKDAAAIAAKRLAIALFVALVALLAAWGLGYWTLARPIRMLTGAAEQIGAGDLTARTRIGAVQPAEIRVLGATLNETAERLSAAQGRLQSLADEDGLTGLANRRRFDDEMKAACARAERDGAPLSTLLIDVDHFKSFNDNFGHLAGDDALRRIGAAIRACANRPGDVAARYGGEEFAVILPNTGADGAASVAARILSSVRDLRIAHGGAPGGVATVSIGSASSSPTRRGALTPEMFVRTADEALYAAKAGGRNRHAAGQGPGLALVPRAEGA